MKTKKEHKILFLFVSFIIPVLILSFIFAVNGMYPFGGKSIMTGDITYQFIDYLAYYKTIFFENNDFTYTFSKTLGGDMAGFAAYYLYSPFNLILLLFPNKWLPVGLMIMIILKCGLCGTSFFYMLSKLYGFRKEGIIFSTTYALMGYIIVYFQLYAYFDNLILLPFILLGIHNLISNPRNKISYIIPLFLSIIDNYYIGWMLCIFSALYFVYRITLEINTINDFKKKFSVISSFAISSIVAGMMSSFVIIPTLLSLRGEKDSFHLGFYRTFEMSQLFSRFYTNSFKGNVSGCLPNIYCGVLIVLLAGFYFFQKKVSKKERILSACFLLFLFFNFYINILNVIWHGLNLPIGFPYRYSFLVTFLMLLFAYRSYLCMEGSTSDLLFLGSLIVYVSYSVFLLIRGSEVVGKNEILLDGFILSLILILFFIFSRKKFDKRILFGFLFIIQTGDLIINANDAMKYFDFTDLKEYQAYVEETGSIVNQIKEKDKDFYRIEKYYRRTHNDPMQFNYSGLTHFSSCEKKEIISYMGKLGFRDNGNWSFYNSGSTAFVDCLFGIKYIISQFDSTGKPYTISFDYNDKRIFENPYALPFAFCADEKVRAVDFDTDNLFRIQNDLADAITGDENHIFKEAVCTEVHVQNIIMEDQGDFVYYKTDRSEEDSYIEYSIHIDNENVLQVYFAAPELQDVELFLNGNSMGGYFEKYKWDIMDFGSHKEGDIIKIRMTPKSGSFKLKKAYFYYEDQVALRNWYEKVSSDQCEMSKITSSHLRGNVNSKKNNCLIFSIPYEEGWKVFVDGMETETREGAGKLLSIDILEGNHEIELIYKAAGQASGITISCISFLFLLYILWIDKRKLWISKNK